MRPSPSKRRFFNNNRGTAQTAVPLLLDQTLGNTGWLSRRGWHMTIVYTTQAGDLGRYYVQFCREFYDYLTKAGRFVMFVRLTSGLE